MKETNVTQGLEKNNIRVIETPLVAARPVKPRKALILALALLGGLFAAVGVVFALDMADSSIRSVDQAETTLALSVLSAIPESRRKDIETHSVLTADPASHEAEAFRSLRTALSFLGPEAERKTVLFTSANPDEGKSYCSFNYAAALAQQGLKTLLIDADLRRPSLSEVLLGDRRGPGLSACLIGRSTILESYRAVGIENLFVMGAGERAVKPAELLASGRFAELLKEAALHFDRIVIDSAPVNAVSDTLLIVKEAQSVALVVRAGKTPRRAIIRACHLLAKAGGNPDGIVLNRMAAGRRAGYYAYYYAGDYVKGETYGPGNISIKG